MRGGVQPRDMMAAAQPERASNFACVDPDDAQSKVPDKPLSAVHETDRRETSAPDQLSPR